MASTASADTVVVGGGVIGLSIAWTAAARGITVAVVDPDPGHGASWAAAGMLAPVGEAHFGEEALTALNLRASRAWPEFAVALESESGRPVDYQATGTLLVAADPSDLAATDDVVGFHLEHGRTARRLSSRECRSQEPLLAPGVRGGAELSEDHQVDNRHLMDALVAACQAHGVTFIRDQVAAVETENGQVSGVALGRGGHCAARTVVVAAGCRSGQVGGVPEAERPPVRPVKGLTLRLRGATDGPSLRRTVRGLVHGRNCYLVPRRDGTVVVGATVEEKGFDLTVQVGPVSDLLNDARRLIPSLEEFELFDTTAGLRPGSPDNGPIVGPTGLPGLIVATGHYRNGILLAPVTAYEVTRMLLSADGMVGGDAVAESDLDGSVHGSELAGAFAPFGPGRFASTGGRDHPSPGVGAWQTVGERTSVPG
jgi:glycine oxidase